MKFFLKNLFLSPILGVHALLTALPYLIATALAWIFISDVIRPEHEELFSDVLDWMPRRRTRHVDQVEGGAAGGFRILIVGFLLAFTAFRIQRSALRAVGLGATGDLSMLIVPPVAWFRTQAVPFALAAVIVLAVAASKTLSAQLGAPVGNASIPDFFVQNVRVLCIVYLVALLTFAPAGVYTLCVAARLPMILAPIFIRAGHILVIGTALTLLAVPVSIGLVELSLPAFATEATPEPRAPLYVYIAVQGVFLWTTLSVACANLLLQHIEASS